MRARGLGELLDVLHLRDTVAVRACVSPSPRPNVACPGGSVGYRPVAMPMRLPLYVLTLSILACGDDGSPSETEGTESTTESPTTNPSTTSPTTSSTSPSTTDTSGSSDTTEGSSSTSDSSSSGDPTGESGSSSGSTGEDAIAVTISFAAHVNGEEFACGQTYTGVGTPPVDVTPRDLRFFVQDLRLISAEDDSEVPVVLDVAEPWQVETVGLIDFENAEGACADGGGNPATNTQLTGTVPAGDYDGIVFSVGVSEDLNHEDPLFNPAPLHASSMHWGWLFGYIFFKTELQQVEGEGIGLFHLGSSGCEGMPVTCAMPNRNEIRLETFDHASDSVDVDLGSLFGDTDLGQMSMCHSAGDACPPLFDNYGVDFESGLPTGAQVVFGVE